MAWGRGGTLALVAVLSLVSGEASWAAPEGGAAAKKKVPEKHKADPPSAGGGADLGAHLVGTDAPKDQELYEYIIEGLPFIQRAVHGRVWESFWKAYILSWATVPLGGLMWVPKLIYDDVPDGPAKTKARTLGLIGTLINLGGVVFFMIPLVFSPVLLIPVYGWAFVAILTVYAAFMAFWWSLVTAIPVGGWFGKIVLLAYSDAYALPAKGGKKGKKRHAP